MRYGELKQYVLAHIKSAGKHRIACPACEESGKRDVKKSLGINMDAGFFHCFRCGVSGKLRDTPTDLIEEEETQSPQPSWFVPVGYGPGASAESTAPVRDYLASRRIDHNVIVEADLGTAFEGHAAGRVVCPLKQGGDDWWGYSARLIGKVANPATPKYVYPKGMHFGRRMYNQHVLSVPTEQPAIVTEGVFDALSQWPNGIALLGKPSERHIQSLCLAWRPVVIVLDGDATKDAWQLAVRLRLESVPSGMVQLPVGLDPDEVDREWLEREAVKSLSEKL
jgi:hypothetical protein